MNINNIHNVYFIGIGGIGMSALARYFKNIGKNVAGYDKTPTQLTDELQELGINIHFADDIAKIEHNYLEKENTLIVITPAIPKSHSEWNYFISNGFTIKKRAEVLGIITQNTFCFAVAGTHGKTTTSSILAHILYESKLDVISFLGGIVENYNSNLIGNGKTVTVVEADEFDRSFLHLHPNVACITSIDADHLDIYENKTAFEDSFKEFALKVASNNLYITHNLPLQGIKVCVENKKEPSNLDIVAYNIRIENGNYVFHVKYHLEVIKDIVFSLPGHHNIYNALMALAMAKSYGVTNNDIKSALQSFKGIRRRFSYQIKTEKLIYIDDYAHHPTEINAVYQAVKERYADKKNIAIFQPHLFSRTRDFLNEFANSLSQFDEILLLDIYPARELPIEGVTSEKLLEKINNENKKLITKDSLFKEIINSNAVVYITIGAGDIGEMVKDIKNTLNEKA